MFPDDDRVLDCMVRGAEEMDRLTQPKKRRTWPSKLSEGLEAVVLFIPRLLIGLLGWVASLFKKPERRTWE